MTGSRGRPFPLPKTPPKPDTVTLGKALNEYEDWYRKNRRATRRKRLLSVLEHVRDALEDEVDTRTITRDDIQCWIDSRTDGRSAITVRGDSPASGPSSTDLRAAGRTRPTPAPAVASPVRRARASPRKRPPSRRMSLNLPSRGRSCTRGVARGSRMGSGR